MSLSVPRRIVTPFTFSCAFAISSHWRRSRSSGRPPAYDAVGEWSVMVMYAMPIAWAARAMASTVSAPSE